MALYKGRNKIAGNITTENLNSDISGYTVNFKESTDEIPDFNTFLDSIKPNLTIGKFIENFVTGMKYVLHTGKLINHGLCSEPGFALDARYGKTLMEEIEQLNSKLVSVYDTLNRLNQDPLIYRGHITGDLNRADSGNIKAGYYNIRELGSITNSPAGVSWCTFFQLPANAYRTQIIFDASGIYTRKYTGDPPVWSSWIHIIKK